MHNLSLVKVASLIFFLFILYIFKWSYFILPLFCLFLGWDSRPLMNWSDQNVVYGYDIKSSSQSRKMLFMSVQNVTGALVSPKSIIKNLYEPYLV